MTCRLVQITRSCLGREDSVLSHVHSAIAVPRVSQPWNIPWLLQEQAARISKALALLSPKRAPLTSGHLDRPMAEVVPTLHATGVDREEGKHEVESG